MARPCDSEAVVYTALDFCVAMVDLSFVTGGTLFDIELPILTEKEKRALDKLLPCATALDHTKLEFELRPTEVAAYQRFYLEYPVFNEVAA